MRNTETLRQDLSSSLYNTFSSQPARGSVYVFLQSLQKFVSWFWKSGAIPPASFLVKPKIAYRCGIIPDYSCKNKKAPGCNLLSHGGVESEKNTGAI